MSEKYTYLDDTFLESQPLPTNTKAIYVLNSNHTPSCQPVSIYVGITNSPSIRFPRHSVINWHWGKFYRPATIRFAAIAPQDGIVQAEQDLINRFTAAGYPLMNTFIKDPEVSVRQQDWNLPSASTQGVLGLLANGGDGSEVIEEWLAHWEPIWAAARLAGSHDAPVADDPLSSLFTTASGTDIRTHPSFMWARPGIRPVELCHLVISQQSDIYHPAGNSGFGRQLVLAKIATYYDPHKGYAEVSQTELASALGTEHNIGNLIRSSITGTGLWATTPRYGTTPTKYFPLFVDGTAELYLSLSQEDEGMPTNATHLRLVA